MLTGTKLLKLGCLIVHRFNHNRLKVCPPLISILTPLFAGYCQQAKALPSSTRQSPSMMHSPTAAKISTISPQSTMTKSFLRLRLFVLMILGAG